MVSGLNESKKRFFWPIPLSPLGDLCLSTSACYSPVYNCQEYAGLNLLFKTDSFTVFDNYLLATVVLLAQKNSLLERSLLICTLSWNITNKETTRQTKHLLMVKISAMIIAPNSVAAAEIVCKIVPLAN